MVDAPLLHGLDAAAARNDRVIQASFENLAELPDSHFDVVTMNIIPEVILPLLGDVVEHVQGTIILSGILLDRAAEVVAACKAHGLCPQEERKKGEWWAGSFMI